LPGLAMHYTVDGSTPTAASARYDGPLTPPSAARFFKIACFDSRGRASRSVTLDLEAAANEQA
jgi:hexosaminidase